MTASASATSSPFHCVLDVQASLGECPLWSAAEQVLYWVDINAPSLNRFDPATGRNTVMPMPESIGCFALRRNGGFVVALRSGFWLADADGTLNRKVADAPYDPTHHRFNDGRCDPQGRFLAGYMNETRDAKTAALVRLDRDFTQTRVLEGMTISNGLAFSPDGRTMYHADTPTRPRGCRQTRACSRASTGKATAPTALPSIATVVTGPHFIAEERCCGSRRMDACSPSSRSRRCARRCAHSAAAT